LIIELFVRLNQKFRKPFIEGHPLPVFSEERDFNFLLFFDESFREKTLELMWGSTNFWGLLPSEQNMVSRYINYTAEFNELIRGELSALLHLNPSRDLRAKETVANCHRDCIEKATQLIYGDKEIGEFTRDEIQSVKIYINHNLDFRKRVREILIKSFEQLSPMEIRLLSLYSKYDINFKFKTNVKIDAELDLEDLSQEEKRLISLYVNCDSDFQEKAKKLMEDKKSYSAEEQRVAKLYVNFDVAFQMQARQLVKENHKKGGFHDTDAILTYNRTKDFRLLFKPRSSLEFEKQAPAKIDFTPEEEVIIKLYIQFHLAYRKELAQMLQTGKCRNKNEGRVFALAMWYNHELREKIFGAVWDLEKVKELLAVEKRNFLDYARARRDTSTVADEEWNYLYLGSKYYQVAYDTTVNPTIL